RRIDETGRSYLAGVMQALEDTEAAGGFRITGRRALVESVLADPKQLMRTDRGPWSAVDQNVGEQLPARLTKDRPTLGGHGLITEGHQLAEVTFTGSDFHKGGQQVLFLRLTYTSADAPAADPRTLVYKPSSLAVDAELFGRGASVAHTLDPSGQH